MTSAIDRPNYRSSHWSCSIKKDVLKNFTNFTGKHLRWSLFLIKLLACSLLYWWRTAVVRSLLYWWPAAVARGLRYCGKRLQHKSFPVKFAKSLRTPFFRTSANDCFYKYTNLFIFTSVLFIIITSRFSENHFVMR